MKSKHQIRVRVFDKALNQYVEIDGEIIVFENKIAAKNFLFTQGYKYEFVQKNFVFENIDDHEF